MRFLTMVNWRVQVMIMPRVSHMVLKAFDSLNINTILNVLRVHDLLGPY